MRDAVLAQAIAELGGVVAVAAFLDLTPSAVSQWERVPLQHVMRIVRATGNKFTPEMLRPDIYEVV